MVTCLILLVEYLLVMASKFKLDSTGKCSECKAVPVADEVLKCFICNSSFHGNCNVEDKIGLKTLVINFTKKSTKDNFKFFCDSCLTKFEFDMSKTENDKIVSMENSLLAFKTEFSSVKSELSEIKSMLCLQGGSSNIESPSIEKPANSTMSSDNVWFNKERLEKTKLPPVQPMLILNKDKISASESIENVIYENKIPVTKTYTNSSGDVVMVCDSIESRDRLKDLTKTDDFELKSVAGKKNHISIVGFNKMLSKDDALAQVMAQNQFLKQFSMVNDINDHLVIHDVKSIKSNDKVFQAFASVSNTLREGFRCHKDKVTIGMLVCKIYDRQSIKRCNNCQGLGHYYKECKSPSTPICAKCSGNHRTDTCTSDKKVMNITLL